MLYPYFHFTLALLICKVYFQAVPKRLYNNANVTIWICGLRDSQFIEGDGNRIPWYCPSKFVEVETNEASNS
jgi:hypothetical protein